MIGTIGVEKTRFGGTKRTREERDSPAAQSSAHTGETLKQRDPALSATDYARRAMDRFERAEQRRISPPLRTLPSAAAWRSEEARQVLALVAKHQPVLACLVDQAAQCEARERYIPHALLHRLLSAGANPNQRFPGVDWREMLDTPYIDASERAYALENELRWRKNPLMNAFYSGNRLAAELLQKYGARADAKGLPLMAKQWLRRHPVDWKPAEEKGPSPFPVAIAAQNTKAYRSLKSRGASLGDFPDWVLHGWITAAMKDRIPGQTPKANDAFACELLQDQCAAKPLSGDTLSEMIKLATRTRKPQSLDRLIGQYGHWISDEGPVYPNALMEVVVESNNADAMQRLLPYMSEYTLNQGEYRFSCYPFLTHVINQSCWKSPMDASKEAITPLVRHLLADSRVDVNARYRPPHSERRYPHGATALMAAVKAADVAVVREILAHPDVDPALRDHRDRTALDWAKRKLRKPPQYYLKEWQRFLDARPAQGKEVDWAVVQWEVGALRRFYHNAYQEMIPLLEAASQHAGPSRPPPACKPPADKADGSSA